MRVEFDATTEISEHVRTKAAFLLHEQMVAYVRRFGPTAPYANFFWVNGSSDDVHNVVIRVWRGGKRKALANCSCEAGQKGVMCAHSYACYRHVVDRRLP